MIWCHDMIPCYDIMIWYHDMTSYHDMIPVNGRFAVDREFVYITVPLLKHFVGREWCKVGHLGLTWPILGLTWPILAPRCAPRGLEIEIQRRSKSHLGSSWRQEGAQCCNLKNGDHFPRKCAKNLVNNSKNEPPVILCRICRKWGVGLQVRTSLQHAPGSTMMVAAQTPSNGVYHV